MDIAFEKFSCFSKGLMYTLLEDAYSFDINLKRDWASNWKEADEFFYDNLCIADACGFVTTVNHSPIGFICWDPRHSPDYVEIGHNCIATKHKGQRLGQRQLQEAVKRIATLNAKKIVVTTNEMLIPARKNYESVGFVLVERRVNAQNPEAAGKLIDYEMRL